MPTNSCDGHTKIILTECIRCKLFKHRRATAKISVKDVVNIRQETGASPDMVRRALIQSNGDKEQALELLRQGNLAVRVVCNRFEERV